VTNARVARVVSDIFIWLGVLGGLSIGVAFSFTAGLSRAGDLIFGVSLGFGVLLQLLSVALVLRLLADIADGVWRD
jgi:hypothetical protein